MNFSRIINGVFIIIGAFVAIYAQAQEQQNTYVLILGIVLLMVGLYRISRNIPSKHIIEEDESENADD